MSEVFRLVGELNFSNVAEYLLQGKKQIETHPSLSIDLHDVTQCDSAGLALLIAWVRYAKQRQTPLHFVRGSSQLHTLAEVCGLKNILPFQ